MKGRAIIVHSLDHARTALAAARELNVVVALLSPPGAAGYMGAEVFCDIIKQASLEYPEVDFTTTLDCGTDPGLALGSLRQGVKKLKINLKDDTKARIKDIANQYHATIDDDSHHADALDLLYQEAPVQACLSWLGKVRLEKGSI